MGLDIGWLKGPRAAALPQHGDDPPVGRRVGQRAFRGWKRSALFIQGHDARRVQSGKGFALLVELRISRETIAGVGPKGLRQVPSMAIDVVVGEDDDLVEQDMRQDLADRARGGSRERAVEVEPVDWRQEAGARLKHRLVDNRNGDDRSGQVLRPHASRYLGHRGDPRVLGRVDAGCQAQGGPWFRALNDDDRKLDGSDRRLADADEAPLRCAPLRFYVSDADDVTLHATFLRKPMRIRMVTHPLLGASKRGSLVSRCTFGFRLFRSLPPSTSTFPGTAMTLVGPAGS